MKYLTIISAAILAATTAVSANPIPWPPPASMPLEDMHVEIRQCGNGLHAVFTGDFTFDYIPVDVLSMLFPVPPDAANIGVRQDDVEIEWAWSAEDYPTILPEMPQIPMIEWAGPFPETGAIFRVDYEHDLIERPNELIFFYAVGTGKYFPTYEKTTTAYFDILLPGGFSVSGVWLDETPHDYQVIGSHLMVTIQSAFGPITKDLIVSLVPDNKPTDFGSFAALGLHWLETDCNEPDWCGGADLSCDGAVDMNDVRLLADRWLEPEADELAKPALARYYVPYEAAAEPDAPGYTLPLDLNHVSNYDSVDARLGIESAAPLLRQNGFAVVEYDFGSFDPNRDDIVKPYEYLSMMDVPLFVTSDTLLHLYHIQFDETLKDVEEREFFGDIRDLTAALLDKALAQHEQYTGDLKKAAKRNVAYLAVARKLIDPTAEVPGLVAYDVAGELGKIDAHEGFANSDIFIYKEDYSQYVPRGHYTRSELLKRYFRTLMWYGRTAFLLKGAENWGQMGTALISMADAKIQTTQAVLLARSIDQVKIGRRTGREVWDRIYTVTAFYVGLADDLTPHEYLVAVNKVFGSSFEPSDLADEDEFFALKAELALLRSPQIFGGTGNPFVKPPITPESLNEVLDKTKGMRFMGQRFIPDSYMFQHLVFPEVGPYTADADPKPFTYGFTGIFWGRCFPRGLDVMAVLGSKRAKTILVGQGDTDYINYWLRFNDLKAQFDAFGISDWNRNLYWGWLYSLRALVDEFGEGYPSFMQTEAWEKKQLNAALASWAELRHDTILYAKQSYTPVGTGLPPPPPPGYVEPVPEFYARLLALTRMTRQGLSDLDALSVQATERLVSLENILSRLIEIANKELMNQELSNWDNLYIKNIGKILEGAVTGVEGTGVKTTLVADVHTDGNSSKVLEEGVGYVDLIIAACPAVDGSIFLAAGPVLSYYEFKHPMSDRLTDEAWRDLLKSPEKPERPPWFQPLMP